MSTSVKHYVMVGINIGFKNDDDFYEELEPYMNEGEELFCLFDGMSGKYVILGEILHQGNEYEGMDMEKFSLTELRVMSDRVKHNLDKFFGIKDVEPELIAVSHWR